MGMDWRARSAENVFREIEWQVRELGVREICIYDDNFSMDRARVSELCGLITANGLDLSIQFTNGLRVDCLDERILEDLKRVGTWLIGLAPETGNREVMKRIKKGFDQDRVLETREICRRLGVFTFGFFMIGFPFESRQSILDTLDFSVRLDCEMVEFNKVVPYSNTELGDMVFSSGSTFGANDTAFAATYHDGLISTHRVGDLSAEEVRDLIHTGYRRFYLRPRKIVDLLRCFSIRDLFTLTKYALVTGNI
jgi:radical SAM superfamily enzyme YgiQ (UPF0313 family)